MNSRESVFACVQHQQPDRLPIRHLAVSAVDKMLMQHFNTNSYNELLDILVHDFREIQPVYCGPKLWL